MTSTAPTKERTPGAVGTARGSSGRAKAAPKDEATIEHADPPGEMPQDLVERGWTLKENVDAEGRFQCVNAELTLSTNTHYMPQDAIRAARTAQVKYDAKHTPAQIAEGAATAGKGYAVARRFSQPLKVRLSPDGLQEKCAEYDAKCDDKERMEAEFKKVHDRYKEDLKVAETEVQQLSAVIRKQHVEVETDCEERFYYDRKLVCVTRLDTGEIINERDMSATELQQKLPSL